MTVGHYFPNVECSWYLKKGFYGPIRKNIARKKIIPFLWWVILAFEGV